MATTLFDDIFKITATDSARYDRVTRINAQSNANKDIHLTLDVNSELFPVEKGSNVTLAIASTLTEGEDTTNSWREQKAGEHSLADDYDYVMYGTIYKFEESGDDSISVYCSFGGLLMCLEGGYRKLSNLKQDKVYLLMRR